MHHTIQQDLKHHHLTLPKAADLAQNRPLWRMMSTYSATQSWVAWQKRRCDVMQARPMLSCGVRPSLCVSVKTSKHKTFFTIGSHTILVFPYQTSWQYSDGDPLMGALNAGGVGINRNSELMSGFIWCCQSCDRPGVINAAPLDRGKLWQLSLVVSSRVCWGERWRRNAYDQKPHCYARDNRTTF